MAGMVYRLLEVSTPYVLPMDLISIKTIKSARYRVRKSACVREKERDSKKDIYQELSSGR